MYAPPPIASPTSQKRRGTPYEIPRPNLERATRFERATICLEGDPARLAAVNKGDQNARFRPLGRVEGTFSTFARVGTRDQGFTPSPASHCLAHIAAPGQEGGAR